MIEVGEYVRTNKGNIGNVIDIFQGHCTAKYHIQFQGNVKVKRQYLSTKTIVKHSKNIIDLIEVGDYVNGILIEDIEEIDNKKVFYSNGEMIAWTNRDKGIETILTKEQYQANCYTVERKEK